MFKISPTGAIGVYEVKEFAERETADGGKATVCVSMNRVDIAAAKKQYEALGKIIAEVEKLEK